MANGLYAKGREGFLAGDISWRDDDIRVILIDTGTYTVDLATHQFLSSVAAGARIAVSGALSGKTITDGVADATDPTFSAVSGATIEAYLIYLHTGVDATARLIAYIDSVTSGLPITPNGGDILLTFGNSATKIFKL